MANPEDCPYDQAMLDRRQAMNNDHAVRIALLEQGMKNITTELHGINTNISKLIWLAVAAIGTSFIQFILRGGLL
jgi:hypothetical protein